MVGWTTRAGLSSPLPHQTSDRRFSSHSERSHGPSSTDHGGGKRRLVISRKSGAESELVRAYTCVVELDAFNALSPPVRQPRRWFRLAPRTSLGEEARPPTATETCRRLCCVTPTILERNAHSGNSGSLAILAAIRRASSLLSSLAAE